MANLLNSFSNNILLSNLINIRWIAIIGQLTAILYVYFFLNIHIPILPCILIVLISVIINILSFNLKKNNDYLSENKTFYFLLFDTFQLSILLFLTGGIYNPFSILLIAPLIISASYLNIFFSVTLSFLSILIVIFISFFYIEIDWNGNFDVPLIFTYGLVLSLIISLIFIVIYVYVFSSSARNIAKALNQTRNVLANQKKLSEIGSLSAAAVHEFSTPLNSIFIILDELQKNELINKKKEIQNEIQTLKTEAERCKKILLRLSKNPQNLKDEFLSKVTISNIIKINFDKFNNNNISININSLNKVEEEPKIIYQDEVMYGIGNIIQNALEHAKSMINVNIKWTQNNFMIEIIDDGPGFSKEILDKIGKPYISQNKKNGMGLGIFIAKNLIENINGKIFFKNNVNVSGSIVEITLIRSNI